VTESGQLDPAGTCQKSGTLCELDSLPDMDLKNKTDSNGPLVRIAALNRSQVLANSPRYAHSPPETSDPAVAWY
jgi:hypothetical protein